MNAPQAAATQFSAASTDTNNSQAAKKNEGDSISQELAAYLEQLTARERQGNMRVEDGWTAR